KRLPDLDAHIDNAHGAVQHDIEVQVNDRGQQRTYRYRHADVNPDVHYGSKNGVADADKLKWLIDNPGRWDCMLRKEGHTIREFSFTVDAKGMVLPSEMQKGPRPVPTLADVVLIDMKIPADNGVETRIRPDAMRKSIGFGAPWPDGAKVKEVQAAFP